jgi:hypothetical protein
MPKLILCTFMLELGLDLHSPLAGPLFTIDDDDFDHTRSFQHAGAETEFPFLTYVRTTLTMVGRLLDAAQGLVRSRALCNPNEVIEEEATLPERIAHSGARCVCCRAMYGASSQG